MTSFLNTELQAPYRQQTKKPTVSVREHFRESILQVLACSKNNRIFMNSVVEEHPEVADSYLNIISFPICLSQTQQNILSYTYIGEVIRDLLLISQNCKTFNKHHPELLEFASQYEAELLQLINEFLKSLEVGNQELNQLQFKNINELIDVTLQREFRPGKAPKVQLSQKSKQRTPVREDADTLVYKLEMLNDMNELYCIGCLMSELHSQEAEDGKEIIRAVENDSFSLDLQTISRTTFWWFYEVVREQFIEEFGAEKEQQVNEKILEMQSGNQYINILATTHEGM